MARTRAKRAAESNKTTNSYDLTAINTSVWPIVKLRRLDPNQIPATDQGKFVIYDIYTYIYRKLFHNYTKNSHFKTCYFSIAL